MNDEMDVIEERPPVEVTRELVEARVENWKSRLRDLFQSVNLWASENGWRVDDGGTVAMDEELMRKFGVPATVQPTLRLDSDRGYALFKPKGLWVIGANGRIDLYTSKGVFIIVDRAERSEAPQWTIFRATAKPDGNPFTPTMIGELV